MRFCGLGISWKETHWGILISCNKCHVSSQWHPYSATRLTVATRRKSLIKFWQLSDIRWPIRMRGVSVGETWRRQFAAGLSSAKFSILFKNATANVLMNNLFADFALDIFHLSVDWEWMKVYLFVAHLFSSAAEVQFKYDSLSINDSCLGSKLLNS